MEVTKEGGYGRLWVMKERIAQMLTAGINPEQIASAYGVTPDYLQELIATDEGLQTCLQAEVNEVITKEADIRNEYDAIEGQLLEAIKVGIASAEFKDLPKALEALNKMNPRIKAEQDARDREKEIIKANAKRLAAIEDAERQQALAKAAAAGGAAGAAAGVIVGEEVRAQISLQLPAFIVKPLEIEKDARGEIREIEGRKLSPLSFEGFQKMIDPKTLVDVDPQEISHVTQPSS